MKSSWSPASLDPNIYSHSSGCILSLLRRMLCSTSLPTHPSESDHHSLMSEEKKDKKPAAEKAVPSLVARLMGLDSIPERMITRSRSLNSADHLKKEEEEEEEEGSLGKKLHRRSKSSLSFRESPTYIELDDDEFIVLRFDNGPPKKALHRRSRDKTSSAGNDEELRHTSMEQEGLNARTRKQIRLAKKKQTAESSDSEESSPVSVFDFQGTDTPTSAEEDSWTRSTSSTRVSVSSPEPDNTEISTDQDDPRTETVESKQEHALLNNTVVVVVNSQKRNREMWARVCHITVAEINGAAEGGDKDAKDLAAELEVHITDLLLNELLHSI